jgi:hypothetical protein
MSGEKVFAAAILLIGFIMMVIGFTVAFGWRGIGISGFITVTLMCVDTWQRK